ncbi:MAG TPA: TetR family transcriptional regulator C-terminal domain-containing protein [Saprospiraceae bacterium]|nr:TetR family transcriptional regulator C-terminal domain-containing protein [Saprospiraceae bacterium]
MNQKHDKQEILLKGIFLLRRQGYHNTGINDILQECQIPKGSFYNFFRSKEDFGLQALELYGESMLRLMQKFTRNEDLSPYERLVNFLEITIQANEEEDMQYGCLSMNFSVELAGYKDSFARLNADIFDYWTEELTACISEAQELGEVRSDYDAKTLAQFLYTNLFGAYARGKSERSTNALRQMVDLSLDNLFT